METLLAAASVATTTAFLPPSSSSPSFLRTGAGSGNAAARSVRCAAAKYLTLDEIMNDELINAPEVMQWEMGMTYESIAAAQGIRISRRGCTGRYRSNSKGTGIISGNILQQIVWDKESEVYQRNAKNPLENVKEAAEHAPPARDFVGALDTAHRRNGAPALIAEVKQASPVRGLLREHFNPVQIAQTYEKNGAACLSILTDEMYFKGCYENMETVRNSGVKCPILCKDFIVDAWQVYYARSKGADAVILIAAVLPNIDIKYMLRICKDLGMTALIEVHDERELDRVLNIGGVQLIGINNRDLETFEVDIANTKMLLQKRGDDIRSKGILVVSESGLSTPDDIAYVHDAGASVVLVGESLLTQDDPGQAIAGLYGKELMH